MNSNQNDLIIALFNKLFESFKKKNFPSLAELSQEKLFKALLLEIEPNIESIGGVIAIKVDHDFGVRYGNFLCILNSLEKYLSKSPDVGRFTQNTKIKKFIIINDVLKNENEQLMYLAEILLFMSSISSKKEYYLDKIGEIDDIRYVNLFFQSIEKYMVLDKVDETNNNSNQSQSHLDRSYMINTHFLKMKEDYEKERMNLIKLIKDGENQIAGLKLRNENLEKALSETEMKLKDKEREYEMVKTHQNQHIKLQEQLFQDSLANTDLISQLTQKDNEISDMKRECEMIKKRHNEEIQKLKEKIEAQDDKIQEYKTIKAQYDKLNFKYKEITNTKDKKSECDNIKLSLEQKNKQVEILIKEKKGLSQQLEKLNCELNSEKEKLRQSDFERKKQEYDITNLKKELAILKTSVGGININNISSLGEDNKFLIDGNSLLFDELKKGGNQNTLEKEFIELRNEKNELMKLYKSQIDEIHKLIDEKQRLIEDMDSLKLEIEKKNSEKERLGIEREKVEIHIQKLGLENQKLSMHLDRVENDKKKIDEENKELMEQVEAYSSEKNIKNKELEKLKAEFANNKTLVDKLITEKQGLISEYQHLIMELDKYKQKKGSITKPGKNSTNPNANLNLTVLQNDTEVLSMKNEIQNLKLSHIQKDEMIKNLQEKVEAYESMEINREEYTRKAEELEFYKSSYEEQKHRVNREHELITNSLYDLALQFMSVKTDLQKTICGNRKE